MLQFNDRERDAVRSSTQKLGVFFRLSCDPVQRLWLGVGNCRVGINAEDKSGAIYKGFGVLTNVPVLQQLVNGRANRAEFQITGVSQATLKKASIEAITVRGAPVAVGIGMFGADWQQLGVPIWLWRGTADVVSTAMEETADGQSRSISLSVGSRYTGRRRRALSFLTDHDQQLRHPGDSFCERTSLYSADVDKVWPRFDA